MRTLFSLFLPINWMDSYFSTEGPFSLTFTDLHHALVSHFSNCYLRGCPEPNIWSIENGCVLNKSTIKAWDSCSWRCSGTSAPSAPYQMVSFCLCSAKSNISVEVKDTRRGSCWEEQKRIVFPWLRGQGFALQTHNIWPLPWCLIAYALPAWYSRALLLRPYTKKPWKWVSLY